VSMGPWSLLTVLAILVVLWVARSDWALYMAVVTLTALAGFCGAEWLARVLTRRWRAILALVASGAAAAVLLVVPTKGTTRLIAAAATGVTLGALFYSAALWEILPGTRRTNLRD
jgi:zinc transporter ZupT